MPFRKWVAGMIGKTEPYEAGASDIKLVADHLRILADAVEDSVQANLRVDWRSIEKLSSGILKVALDAQARDLGEGTKSQDG